MSDPYDEYDGVEDLGDDDGGSDDSNYGCSTSYDIVSSSSGVLRLFVVDGVLQAKGGHRPSFLCTGHLVELGAAQGAGLQLVPVMDATLQLSIRYEPPSPKFTRQQPECSSYRLKLLQGPQFLYLLRGLPKTVLLDREACAATWGSLQLVFRQPSFLTSFMFALRHVTVLDQPLWQPEMSTMWLAPDAADTWSSWWYSQVYRLSGIRAGDIGRLIQRPAVVAGVATGVALAVWWTRSRQHARA